MSQDNVLVQSDFKHIGIGLGTWYHGTYYVGGFYFHAISNFSKFCSNYTSSTCQKDVIIHKIYWLSRK